MAMPIEQLMQNTPVQTIVPIFDFTNKRSGDQVQCADGPYSFGEKVFVVENGMIQNVWADEEGQMAFELEGI